VIISRAPLRISFFGGGTDYREYFHRKKGLVLGATIDKYTYVSVNRLSDFFEYKIRVGYSKAELVNTIDEIIHPSVRETLRFKAIKGNLDIHIFADLPARTGLGSSSSFTVGFLNALYALEGKIVSKQQLAQEAIHIEQNLIKENVGSQDQVHSAFGGINIIEFNSSGFSVRPVIISSEKVHFLNDRLMAFYTSLTRYASDIVQEQVENTKNCVKDDYLDRMASMVLEAETIISDRPNEDMVESLGKLLNDGWQLKKCLSSKVSNEKIDQYYQAGINAGAYGGKLAGAGGGGFLFFLVPKEKQAAVRSALSPLLEVKFRFEDEGSKIIYLMH
jgi:D-glycero-alpha-D-manno-heptose-7-phosphate kinase